MSSQSLEALAKANAYRLGGAELRRQLGTLSEEGARLVLAEMLSADVPLPVLGSSPIARVLIAIPRRGQAWAAHVLRHADVRSPNRKIRDLTPRQRGAIADELRAPYGTGPRVHRLGRMA